MNLPAALEGKQGKCPKCGVVVTVVSEAGVYEELERKENGNNSNDVNLNNPFAKDSDSIEIKTKINPNHNTKCMVRRWLTHVATPIGSWGIAWAS
jgi:hypothetical protein